ncbi:MAG TPA: hypothetical protein VF778_08715, partial [Xanthobacteraceae bacterium]
MARVEAQKRAQGRAQGQAQGQAQVSVQRPARQSPSPPARPTLSQAAALRPELPTQQALLEMGLLRVA